MKTRASKPASPPKKLPKRKDALTRQVSFPIVAIGASAGGLEAYKEFFHALPPDTGMAFVLIQHLDPSHESMLTEIIAKTTRMPVEEVKSGGSIRPNGVYVIPPNALMALTDGAFQLSPRGKTPGQHLAVNFFMHSLAQERKSGAIGIVLSGTGADGTTGMEEIKAEGGITFAQAPATAKYDGMPRSAIDSGCADFILAPKEMAKELRRIQHHPYVHLEKQEEEDSRVEKPGAKESGAEPQDIGLASSESPSSDAKDFSAVLAQLRKASGVDFSQYKPNTIHRRALRRMLLLKIDSLRDYAAYLRERPEESHRFAFDENGHKRMLNVSVTPMGDKRSTEKGARDNHFFLILFDDVTPQWTPAIEVASERKSKGRGQSDPEARRLKQELAGTRDALRSAIESEDSLKEEFQSANEEILSANEELQSTNEELETSKEELQSANEELGTLNAELRIKNSELHDLSNDISNLLHSTRIPVVMLDRRLSIRRITPAATKLFKVLPADIGRPFADIKLNLEPSDMTSQDLEQQIAKVLDSLQPIEREVRDLEGNWHGLSILPYRTQDNKIDGVVVALQDIHAVKSANEQLAKSAAFFHGTVREPLLVLDAELRVLSANESFLSIFGVSSEQTVNKLLYDLGNGQWQIPALRKLLERVLPEEEAVTDFQVKHDFESIGQRTMVLNARRLAQPDQSQPMILLAIEDITGRGQMIETLRASEERFRTLFNLGPVAVYYCDASGAILNFNHRAAELWGRTPAVGDTGEQFCGSHKMFRPDGSFLPHGQCPMADVLNGTIQEARNQEVLIEQPDGSRVTVIVNIRHLKNSDGEITGAINCFYDISERKLAEAALIKSEKLGAAGRLAATLAHEINNPLQAVANLVSLWAQSPGLDAQSQAHAAMAESELRRVTHLTQQSLSFYRESVSPIPVNLEETIDSVLSIYDKRIEAKRIHITRRYQLNGATIRTYPGELRQVFSTLLLNAMEAVEAGGTIAVRARKASHWQHPSIHGVRVMISDNGVGIPASNIPRIFEPFFTTKGENGTGLGLWVASGIVDRSGGSVLTRSSVDPSRHGTCFSIFLPAKA